MQEIHLLGKDHSDPDKFTVKSIGDKLAIGIASVVSSDEKKHNWANNEDAVGIYKDGDISIVMVADAHWGYVAAQEAVLRFPKHFLAKLEKEKKEDIRQIYLESVLSLADELISVGRNSRVRYPARNNVIDGSVSQFYSVIGINDHYYFVGLGDCYCNIISSNSVSMIKSKNIDVCVIGAMSPRQKMKDHPYGGGLESDAIIRFDDPKVRNGVDVQELQVSKGNVIFLCTDGYRKDKFETLHKRFHNKSIEQGITEIMQSVLHNHNEYGDNIAIAALRVK